jgi:hypothetical protein
MRCRSGWGLLGLRIRALACGSWERHASSVLVVFVSLHAPERCSKTVQRHPLGMNGNQIYKYYRGRLDPVTAPRAVAAGASQL